MYSVLYFWTFGNVAVRTGYSCIYCCLLSWSCGITVNIKPWWSNNCQWNLWPYSHVEIQCCWFHYRCTFANTTGGEGGDRIARRVGANDIMVEAKYQDRFRANISDSQAWLKILRVQRSDEGMYEFRLEPGAGNTITSRLELIVHCKCLPLLIQIKVFI